MNLFTIKLAIIAAILSAVGIWHFRAVSEARQQGIQQERIAWQEVQRRAEVKRLQDQQKLQAKINEIDHQLADEKSAGQRAHDDFEAAIEANARENKTDRSVCALPERVRNGLQPRNRN